MSERKHIYGAWLDTRLPGESEGSKRSDDIYERLRLTDIRESLERSDGFLDELRERLASVRLSDAIKNGTNDVPAWPTQNDDRQAIDDYSQAIEALLRLSPHGGLPPIVRAHLASAGLARGVAWEATAVATEQELRKLAIIVRHAKRTLADAVEAYPQKRGRPKGKKALRNDLLRWLVEKLRVAGLTAESARERAENILIDCQIPAPTGERNIRRATNE
ncbi:hypothetical protein [Bordetella petrii]|uniref:hypothetical protein n=1 Tax=Bordetella petrii TaxID=94624 RepID=UPI001A96A443|nr:hypothetical protein [Bordetella petrii]MBO1110674.1 hypothetical protein [Bordetella petrii]